MVNGYKEQNLEWIVYEPLAFSTMPNLINVNIRSKSEKGERK